MATVQDLFNDMEAATAAGEKDKARRIAQLIGEVQGAVPAPTPGEGGFIAATKAGWENLKGDVAGLAGRAGLMGIPEAEQYRSERKAEADKLFTPTQDDWSESPWLKVKELAGGSAPYMAAPVVAGIAAGAAGAPALAAAGAAGLVSAGQFTGSNLTRQVQEGTPLADTDLSSALLAAVPQAALDMIGLGKIPGVRQLVGLAAKDLGKEGAEKLIGQSLQKIVADYAKATGKAMGTEGITEAGQQVLERLQAGLAINDPAARKEYWDSFVGGAVLGGVISPAGRYVERGQEQGAQKAAALKERQAALQAERAAEEERRQSPEYAAKTVEEYGALEAQQAALQAQIIRGTADKPLSMADKEANKSIGAQLRDLREQNAPLIKEYLRVKDLAPKAPVPEAPRPAFELSGAAPEEDLLGIQEQEQEQERKGYGKEARAADMEAAIAASEGTNEDVNQRRDALSQQLRALPGLLEQHRDAAAKATTPQEQAPLLAKFNEVKQAIDAAKAEYATLPKLVDPDAAAKAATAITKKWEAAKELGDTDAMARYGAKLMELQNAGAAQAELAPKSEYMTPAGPSGTDLGAEMAKGREQAAAQSAKTAEEVSALQRIGEKAAQPSEAQGILTSMARDAQGTPKPAPVYKQQALEGTYSTEGALSENKLQDLGAKMADTMVSPHAVEIEKRIDTLTDQRDQARMAGQEDVAGVMQARIAALQNHQVVNPANATTIATVDKLHQALEQAKKDSENARMTRNVQAAEEAGKRETAIATQLADVQKEPGSLAGRLIKAKNDVSGYLNGFFDTVHELHTAGAVGPLRKKLQDAQLRLEKLNSTPPKDQTEVELFATARSRLARETATLDRRIGDMAPSAPAKMLATEARQAVRRYVRAAFREENIRREAENRPAITGEQRKDFAAQTQAHAEAVLQRAQAERNVKEEVVTQPAIMRSGKVIKGAVTEMQDNRPLKYRPYAKFSAARAVEEEGFQKLRAGIQQRPAPQRVETGILKRQWQETEASKVADERGENATTVTGQQRRRAEYLGNELARAEQTPEIEQLRSALEQYPTNGLMDAVEPLAYKAGNGMNPSEVEMREVQDALAAQRSVGDTSGAVSPQASLFGEGHMRSEKARASKVAVAMQARIDMLGKQKFKSPKAAAQAMREREKLQARLDALEASPRDLRAQPEQGASFERTTAEKFANAPQVRKGRAEADESAQLAADLNMDFEKALAADSAPSEFSKLARKVADLRELIATFKAQRPFASLIGSMSGLKKLKYAVPSKDSPLYGKIFTPADAQVIAKNVEAYNQFVDNTQALVAANSGNTSPEYVSLQKQMEDTVAAIEGIPTSAELVQARALVDRNEAALRKLQRLPEPAKPAGRAARLRNIENAQDALRIARGILNLKEHTAVGDVTREKRMQELEQANREGTARRQQSAVEAKEAAAKMDAAVLERKQMEAAQARLEKLPHTRVTKNAESAFATLIRTGLRKEAAGLESMIEKAKESSEPAEYIQKLEAMLAKSNTSYEQIEGLLPTKIERTVEAGTTEEDDVLQPTEAALYRRPSAKNTAKAVAAAERLEERNKARGRGPVVVNVTGPRKIRTSGAVKAPTAYRAIADANVAAGKKAVRDAQNRLDHIEDLQQKLQARIEGTANKAELKKYAAYEERLAQEHTDATVALDKLQPTTLEEDPFSGEQEAAGDEFASVSRTDENATKLPDAAAYAVQEGSIGRVLDSLIKDGSTPAMRAVAALLKPFVADVKIKVTDKLKHNGELVAGLYTHSNNTIQMSPLWLTEEDTLHELTHAATMQVLSRPVSSLEGAQLAAVRKLQAMHTSITQNPAFAEEYGKKNLVEFVAEVMTNKGFREKLDAIGKPVSMWKRIVEAIKSALGLKSDPKSKQAADAIEKILGESGTGTVAAAPSIIRNGPLDYGDAAGSALAEMADKYTARKMSVLERLKSWSALAFEQGVVDMRAAHAAAMKLGTDATVNSGLLTQQAIYDMRKSDQLMPVIQMSVLLGPPVQYTDAKGLHGTKSSGKNSLREVYEAVAALPGNAEGKMALATNYMIAQRVADVGITKAGWGDMKMDAAELKRVMDGVDGNPKLKTALENVRKLYNAYNEGLVQYMASTGAIPKALANSMLQDGSYVSMYRETSNGHAQLLLGSHTINLGEIRNQPELQALKGGDTKILPINESLLRNTSLLLSMAMKNKAAKSAAYAYQDLGAGTIRKGTGDVDPSVMHFKQEPNSKDPSDTGERWIKIDTEGTVLEGVPSEMIIKALEGTNLVLPSILKIAGAASDMLRSGVTRMPLYAMRQLVRDPMVATGTAGLDGNPLSAVFKAGKEFLSQTRGRSEAAARLAEKGLIQSQIFSGDSHDLEKFALQLADGSNNTNAIQKLFAGMDRASMMADSATRVLVHENALKNGLSEVQADLSTMESMNFHKRGASATIQYAHRLIPFFSSQIQGLSVLAKAVRGNMPYNEQLRIKQKFFNNAVLLFASGLAYAAAMEDDEYYKNAKPRDKMSFWFVPLPGVDEPIKIPIPFEYGFFFSAAVAAVEGMKEDADHPQQFAAMRSMLANAVPGFSNAGMPQLIKPALEVGTNTDFYSWNPIETLRQEKLSPEARYNKNTSELAKRIAEMAPILSPIQIERLVNGYFGQAPLMIAAATNKLFAEAGAPERPTGTNNELPFVGQAFQRKYGGEDADAAYTLANKALKVKATFDSYIAEKRGDKAREYRADHIGEFRSAKLAQNFINAMSELTRREKSIRSSGRSSEEMQKALDNVGAQRQQRAERFHKALQETEATAS